MPRDFAKQRGAVPRVALWDAFSDADSSALDSRPPLIAPPGSSWLVDATLTATLEVGGLRMTDAGDGSGRRAIVDCGESNGTLIVRTALNSINGAFMGIAFRATSVTGSFVFYHRDELNRLEYARPPGGNFFAPPDTIDQSLAFGVSPSDEVEMSVHLDGPDILCTANNLTTGQIAEISDQTSINQNLTLHGVGTRTAFGAGAGDRFTNFLMKLGRKYRPK